MVMDLLSMVEEGVLLSMAPCMTIRYTPVIKLSDL